MTAPAPVPMRSAATRALLLMVASSAAFSLMGACMKLLGGQLRAPEVVFFRCAISVVLTLAVLHRTGRLTRRELWGLDAHSRTVLLLRGLSGTVALLLYVVALLRIRYAEAAALLYTSPLFTALFAHWALREAVRGRGWLALVLGFGGSALVLRPQVGGDLVGGLCALGAGVLSGVAYTSVRAASRSERRETIVLWFAVIGSTIALAVTCVDGFVWPDAAGWAWLALMGLLAQAGQILLTQSLATAPAGTAAVGAFATLALAALWGAVIFGEQLTVWVVAGSSCILGGIALAARTTPPDEFCRGTNSSGGGAPDGVEEGAVDPFDDGDGVGR